jgi:hypothetical protein
MIFNYRIVFNDQYTFVQKCLKEVWSISGAQKICEVIYINNSKVDKSFIEQTYSQCHLSYISVTILLNIYYAREKVMKVISKYHPNLELSDKI